METAKYTVTWLPLLFLAGLIVAFGLIHAVRNRRFGSAAFGIAGALMFFVVALLGIFWIRWRHLDMESRVPATPIGRFEIPASPLPPAPLDANDLENLPDDARSLPAEAPFNTDGRTPPQSDKIDDPTTSSFVADRGPRPAWVDAPIGRVGQVYRARVSVGDYATLDECERNLPEALRQAVTHYVDRLIGAGAGGRTVARLPLPYIHEHIIKEEWEEHREASFGEMVRLHALLEFDPGANTYLRDLHQHALEAERLKYTAVGAGGLFGLLATVFGYLKLDTLTRGYYTGRLRVAAVAILALVASLLVVS